VMTGRATSEDRTSLGCGWIARASVADDARFRVARRRNERTRTERAIRPLFCRIS